MPRSACCSCPLPPGAHLERDHGERHMHDKQNRRQVEQDRADRQLIERAAAHLRRQAILAAYASLEEDVAAGGEAAAVCRDDGSRCGRCTTRCSTRCAPRSCSARVHRTHADRARAHRRGGGERVAARPVGAGARGPGRPAGRQGVAGGLPVPRPEALLRLAADRQSGANVKVVQARLRHASATTTSDCYGHLLARLRRSHQVRRGSGPGGSCGLPADSGGDRSEVVAGQSRVDLTRRSTERTRTGAGAGAAGRSRSCA